MWFPDGVKGRERLLVVHMCFDSPGKFQNIQKKKNVQEIEKYIEL